MDKNIKIINRKSTVNFSDEGLETKVEEKVTNLSPKELKMQIELMNLDKLKVKVGDKILPLKAKDLKDEIELIIDKEDNLQYMMDKQKIFQESLNKKFSEMNDKERTIFIKEHTLWTVDELHEMIHELPWVKPWSKKYENWDKDKLDEQWKLSKEELIDAWHFLLNITIALGLNSNDVLEMYKEKNTINIKRQQDGY